MARDESLTFTLPPALTARVDAAADAGGYASRQAAVEIAINAWLDREQAWRAFKEEIDLGLADVEAGRVHDLDEVRTELRERFADRTAHAA